LLQILRFKEQANKEIEVQRKYLYLEVERANEYFEVRGAARTKIVLGRHEGQGGRACSLG